MLFKASVLVKWRLLVYTLPLTVAFCFVKSICYFQGWNLWNFDQLTSALVGATTFVTAFVLAGTLADYKYGEGLPADLCSAIESIHDANYLEGLSHSDYDPKPLLRFLIQLLRGLYCWLRKAGDLQPVLDLITELSRWFKGLEPFSAPPLVGRLQGEQARLRQIVMRIHVIRETPFAPPAYALLEFFTLATVVALLLAKSTSLIQDLILCSFLFTAFVYLQLLIRDLDNPFEYDGKSSADVSLAVIELTLRRLETTLAELEQRF